MLPTPAPARSQRPAWLGDSPRAHFRLLALHSLGGVGWLSLPSCSFQGDAAPDGPSDKMCPVSPLSRRVHHSPLHLSPPIHVCLPVPSPSTCLFVPQMISAETHPMPVSLPREFSSHVPPLPPPPPLQFDTRVHRKLEGTQLGQLTLADRRDVPHHTTSCSAIKLGGGGQGGHCSGTGWTSGGWCWAIVFICITCLSWVLFFSGFFFSPLFLTVCCCFFLIIKLFLSQPTSFLTFALPILSPIPLGGRASERLCGA